MTHAKRRWSYSTGERGRNRVRAFAHPKTGTLFLELNDRGDRRRIALGHRDREAAKAKVEEVAAALRRAEPPAAEALTLQTLFDKYGREVTVRKSPGTQQKDQFAVRLFLEYFGPTRGVATLSRREWDAFIDRRRRGSDARPGKARGRKVRDRVIAENLKSIQAMLTWATMAGDGTGGYLLERNPFKGLPLPKEVSPRRPMITDDQYRKLLEIARQVSPLFELAIKVTHETGHRIGAVRMLRWSDINFEQGTIRWRGANDKIGFEHETPASPEVLAALARARQERPALGDAWIFRAPSGPNEPVSRHLVRDWWQRGEQIAGIPRQAGLGWHSLRRKFATDLKHIPLKDLCHLGGWKEPQTVLKCYQRADEDTMRSALVSRTPRRALGT